MKITKSKQGAALVIAMIFISICILAVSGYLWVVTKESNMTKKMNDSAKALYLAEAGIERAVSDLTPLDADWSEHQLYSDEPLGEGTFTASIDQVIVQDRKVILKSTGSVQAEGRTITVYVSRSTVFNWAVFGDTGVHLDSNARIDSYDSRIGNYDPNNPNENGDTGTNAIGSDPPVVSLDSNSGIYGDVIIGPGGNVDTDIELDSNSVIIGEKIVASTVTELPIVNPPPDLPYKESINLGGNDNVTISESGQYDFIRLDSNSYITITADVTLYIVGEFSLDSNTHIDIVNNSKVTIYLGGSFSMDSNTRMNENSKDPTSLSLYGTNTLEIIEFGSNAGFYGAIYAPNTDFELDSNSMIYGSLVARSIELDSNSAIHYDEALSDTGPAIGGPLNVDFWQEKYNEI